ncbi:MAG: TonB-dependent receptor domain-containing protein [Bacteroidia bacterium]
MQRKFYLSVILLIMSTFAVFGQAGTGSLQGKVVDELKPKEGIPFANVVIERDGVVKGGTTTDIDGKYKFGALAPGRYDIKVSYVGFNPAVIKGVLVTADRSNFVDVKMTSGVDLSVIDVVDYEVPLISKDETSTGGTITREEIAALPTRDVNSIAATTAGVFQQDEGSALNIRGSRSSSTEYFIDGIRVRGSTNLPNAAIEQTTVITGGIPAQYGDATGGIINITTRGPSSQFFGGAEVLSSSYVLEPYGYNLFALNFSGPLYKKNKGTAEEKSILGYFISGEFERQLDPSPSAIGVWQLNDETLNFLSENPYRPSLFGSGVNRNSEFVTADDMTNVRVRPNANRDRLSLAGKLDFQPTNQFSITLGGNYDRTNGRAYQRSLSLMSPDNMGHFDNSTLRMYGRIRQNFASPGDNQGGLIKNAYYTLQFDYTKSTSSQDGGDALGRNAFNYGFMGNFELDLIPIYELQDFEDDGAGFPVLYSMYVLQGFGERNLRFTPGNIDPGLANWGTSFFNTLNATEFNSLSQVRQFGGLTNGQRPGSAYGIWWEPGRQFGGYNYTDNDQYRLTFFSSADIGGHSLKFGFEYDQRVDRGYSMNPFAAGVGLWGLARTLTNNHLLELDLGNPLVNRDANGFLTDLDTVNFNRLYNSSNQSTFDRRLRRSMGLAENDLRFIQIDAMNPADLDISFFSAEELLNEGNSFISYFGYDYMGQRQRTNPGALDFFSNREDRPIPAFQPIYMAGFIEDKFAFDDLVFRVGVRVDRFDANQPVLRDPFLLYPALTVAEVDGAFNTQNGGLHPSVVPNDAVVYVNDITQPNPTILGYRSGVQWYTSQGVEIRNASGIAAASATGSVTPFLRDREQQEVQANAFVDYTPQINIMPRIAFSFPISDEAQFFAHYDVLTQRPSGFLRFDPRQYYYLQQVGGTLNNPDLKPERTIDYQLGFKQRLTKSSALTISAFYRELRNMIQIINVPFAFPLDYRTFGNIDFGTVKGLTLAYDLRRTGNVRINASYTLQFADGTGSAPQQAAQIIQAGIDNLRTPIPLDFDARHRLVGTLDFRFGEGKNYNGPRINGFGIMEGIGFNFVANAISGTPFSRQTFPTPDGAVVGGLQGRTTLKGGINGSRLPWQFRMNFRVDKDVTVKLGKDKNDKPKEATVNVFVQVLNLFNNMNVINVYQFTGDPSDDGYLASDLGRQQLQGVLDQRAFFDLYTASMDNPGHFSLPRRTRLGIRFNF